MENAKPEKVRFSVTLPVESKEKLDRLAKRENRSVSNMATAIIIEYLRSADK
nr:MAG TPA: CopG-like protein [Caudoviricetes sp.]